jgi:hypothetical protein
LASLAPNITRQHPHSDSGLGERYGLGEREDAEELEDCDDDELDEWCS